MQGPTVTTQMAMTRDVQEQMEFVENRKERRKQLVLERKQQEKSNAKE